MSKYNQLTWRNLHYKQKKLTSASNWGGPSTLLCPDKPCPGKSSANISIGWCCSCCSSADDDEGEDSRSKGANRLNDAALSNQPWRQRTFFVIVLWLASSPAWALLQLLTTSLTPSLQVKVRSDVEMVVVVMLMLRALFVSVVAASSASVLRFIERIQWYYWHRMQRIQRRREVTTQQMRQRSSSLEEEGGGLGFQRRNKYQNSPHSTSNLALIDGSDSIMQ